MSLYGYNSKLLHPVGAYVDGETVVARSGNTGGRAQTELYFEIRKDGIAVDPLKWCRS